MKEKILEIFNNIYGYEAEDAFFAPGRVNLIGEHTDYNGGHVLPCALSIGTYAAVSKRDDDIIRFYSANFDGAGIIERKISETEKDDSKEFTNYPLGVICKLKEAGHKIDTGFDVAFFGNIPNSSGLSSSASIEVLTGFIAKELYNLEITNKEIALISQKAENEFIGVNCGIMDQFIIAMGKKDHATFLDTSTLEFSYIPVKLENQKLVIACSNKKRGLKDSKYNERRAECETAANDLGVTFLGELTNEEFEEQKEKIKHPTHKKRAKHAVFENQRTINACKALQNGDIITFGILMNDSHKSLRDDYEVTGIELDTLVETAQSIDGVIGSRMTGAGFGGCTVSIVKDEAIDNFIKVVGETYESKIGYPASFYVVEIGDGPRKL